MSQEPQDRPSDEMGADEVYIVSDHEQVSYTGTRTATEWVPFFLPHLRPGMSLLDCGCGVGSITLDLAERVAPGQVVGVDLDESQIAMARAEAERRGLSNVRFEVASIYELPFPNGSFDAALAHTLLFHLHDPLRALRVLRQMLKPAGWSASLTMIGARWSSRRTTRTSGRDGISASGSWSTMAAAPSMRVTCAA